MREDERLVLPNPDDSLDEQITATTDHHRARPAAPEEAPIRRRGEALHSPPHIGHTRGLHRPDQDSQPIVAPSPRVVSLGRFQPLAGDSLPPIPDDDEIFGGAVGATTPHGEAAPAFGAPATEASPARGRGGHPGRSSPPPEPGRPAEAGWYAAPALPASALSHPLVQHDLSLDDLSTNLFDSLSSDWEQDDPVVTVVSKLAPPAPAAPVAAAADEEDTRKPWHAGLPDVDERPPPSVVKSIADAIENEHLSMRAMPTVREPRPGADEVVDWPPPRLRPTLDYPPGWDPQDMGDTRIVVDPTARPQRSRVVVLAIDAAAWTLGFAAMFLTGLVTTGSAALVLFAITLKT